ncbi:MAG TPA: AraC family transcriptional regulator [Rhodothermales bacterium]|nr:AraC family transcriptional regulator [Rhodothermales bacterium]
MGQHTGTDGRHDTAIPGLTLYRFSHPTDPAYVLQEPAVYVVAQGRKQVALGQDVYVYDRTNYLVVSVDLPVVGNVFEASPERPYLCLTLAVDPHELAMLMAETGRRGPEDRLDGRGLYLNPITPPLLEGLVRLVRLLNAKDDIPVMAPLVLREVNYRLLQGDEGGRLAQIAIGDGRARRVADAIAWIKHHYTEPLQIEELARQVHMSASSLHHHFRTVTAMSPVQYQKRLRLQEARRLMLTGVSSAEAVADQVGYVSASQFSREYARLFGDPPRKDARRIRESAHGVTRVA